MALSFNDQARKKIHKKYASILKENKVTTKCHNFLKIYLDHQNLQGELSADKPNLPKVKI